jgi:hypothetical protein
MDALNSVWCDAAGDTVMVAGDNGFIFRYSGEGWEMLTADPGGSHFYDLDGTSAHDIFAVGAAGKIVHFDGATWTEMDSGVTETLRAISGNIAVGDRGTITRFGGSRWGVEESGTDADLNAVWVVDDSEAWAVGSGGTILSRDSSGSWTVYERSLYTIDLKSVWGYSPGDIWMGGETGYLVRHLP